MKIATLFFLFFSSLYFVQAQSAFIIDDIADPEISHFCDVEYNDGKYYCLSNHVERNAPYREFANLFIYDEQGQPLEKIELGEYGHQYFQIYRFDDDRVIMAGAIKDTGCLSHLVMAELDLQTKEMQTLSTYPLCISDRIVRQLQFVKGLNGSQFIEGAYGYRISSDNGNRNFVFEISSSFEFTPIFDNLTHKTHFSVDFSQKGYVLKDAYLIDFYDREFNKRKQRYNFLDDYDNTVGSYSHPYRAKYILDQVEKTGGDEQGESLRLLDSNFFIKKLAVISHPQGLPHGPEFPLYGGIALRANTIWTTSNFNYYLHTDSSFVSITKLDSGLNIRCQQFFGFDAIYRMYGISTDESGGVIVFGFRKPKHGGQWSGQEDPFAYKIGEDCELITSTSAISSNTAIITAFPNPSINSISFEIAGFDAATLRCEFFDVSGKVVQQVSDLRYEIRVNELSQGQYFYRILDKDKLIGVGSWVKQ